MLFDNPIFASWYTDTMNVYRVEDVKEGNVTKKQRVLMLENVPCRVYSAQIHGPAMKETAARSQTAEKLSCDLSVDIKAGDELRIVRGGGLGINNSSEQYFAGKPQQYYDPIGGALSGLQHQEVGLLMDKIIS